MPVVICLLRAVNVGGHTCPTGANSPAFGGVTGTFIENFDYRKPSLAGADPGQISRCFQHDAIGGQRHASPDHALTLNLFQQSRVQPGIAEEGTILCGPDPGMSKTIVSLIPVEAFASSSACRKEPAPLSLVL